MGGGRGPVSVQMYVKTKELGPAGGGGVRRKILNVDPPMHNNYFTWIIISNVWNYNRGDRGPAHFAKTRIKT